MSDAGDFADEAPTRPVPRETMAELVDLPPPRTRTRERPADTIERAIVRYLEIERLVVQAADGAYLARDEHARGLARAIREFPDEVTDPIAGETIAHLCALSKVAP